MDIHNDIPRARNIPRDIHRDIPRDIHRDIHRDKHRDIPKAQHGYTTFDF